MYGLLLEEVLERCKGLNLEGIATDRHLLRQLPTLEDLPTPCLIVSQATEAIPGTGTNESDDIDYGVLIASVAAHSRDFSGYEAEYQRSLTWRGQIRSEFYNKRLAVDLPGVCWMGTQIFDGSPLMPEAWRRQYLAQHWVIRYRMWENRLRR